MKKILFLINTLRCGGAEKVLIDLANNLSPEKFDITIQTIDNSGSFINRLSKNVRYKTINNKRGILKKVFGHLLTFNISAKSIYKKYIDDNYDVEIAFLEGLPTKIISASTNVNATKIAWVHMDLIKYFDSLSVYRDFEENRNCYCKFDKIACVSESVKEKFIERFGNPGNDIQTVYNVVVDKEIRRKGNESLFNVKHDYPVMISCGRLCKQKGFDRLLRIHRKLIDENVKHYLWLIGDGEERKEFESYISENGLTKTVTIWGYQDNPYKYIKNADLFVCSSVAEGFSTVVTESAILGTPVISTEVAGAREPIECPRCYKVVNNDEESLYTAIKQLLTDKEEYDKAKRYTAGVSQYFKMEEYLKKVTDFIGE